MKKRTVKRPQVRILDAAFAEFAEKGYAGARIDSIAKKAGLSKQLLYHYYGRKYELYQAVTKWAAAEMEAIMKDLTQRHEEPVASLCRKVAERPLLFKLFYREGWANSPLAKTIPPERLRIYERIVDLLFPDDKRLASEHKTSRQFKAIAVLALTLAPLFLGDLVYHLTGLTPQSEEFITAWSHHIGNINRRFTAEFKDIGYGPTPMVNDT